MKRIAVIFILLILCLSTVGCQGGYNLSKFENLVKSGKYTEAMELYAQTAFGDMERENEMQGVLEKVAQQAIEDYLADAIPYEQAQTQLDSVEHVATEGSIIGDDILEAYNRQLTAANESKIAYDAAKNLLENKNYTAAMEQLQKVTENDCHYKEAQEQLTAAVQGYKTEITVKAKQEADAGNYDKAAQLITEGLKLISDDNELLTLQTTYRESYVKQILEKADKAFVKPGKDYEKAIEMIKPAMQQFPQNAALQEKYQYYMQFEPVSLLDMKPYTYEREQYSTDSDVTDNMGNTYDKVLRLANGYHDISSTYAINKQYNVLTGTVAVPDYYKGRTEAVHIKIYGDGKLLWEKNNITGSVKPFPFSVDITGVTDLKIQMPGNEGWSFYVYAANVQLQRTVK